jgi:hypothetical protein
MFCQYSCRCVCYSVGVTSVEKALDFVQSVHDVGLRFSVNLDVENLLSHPKILRFQANMWAGLQRNTDGDDGICGKSMATVGASFVTQPRSIVAEPGSLGD